MKIRVSILAVALLALAALGSAQQGQGGQGGGGRQGGRGGQRGMMGMGGAMRLTQLLRSEQVQTELKLTDDQKAKVEAMPRPQRGQGGGGQRGGAMDADAMAKQMTEDKAATSAILTPEQETRLEQIRIQWAGPSAVTLPDVQESLGLSADQKTKIATLQTGMRKAMTDMLEKMRNGEVDRADMPGLMQKNNDIMASEVAKVLTADQTAKLKALGGAELKMEPRGGRGGGK